MPSRTVRPSAVTLTHLLPTTGCLDSVELALVLGGMANRPVPSCLTFDPYPDLDPARGAVAR